jgi:hypothetical protein
MTAHPEVSSCSADETLAAFIDDRLSGAERRTVIEHLAECGACRSLVIDATEFKATDEENVVRPRFGKRPGAAIGVLVAVAASLLVVFSGPLQDRFFGPGIDDLVEASEESRFRPMQGRLSAGFPYREFEGTMRGPGDAQTTGENYGLLGKAFEIQSKTKDLHAVGVSHLMLATGEEARLRRERAVAALREALAKADGDERAAVANDLAVALIGLGAYSNDDVYFREALTLVEQELQKERTPELLWNRALVLDKLGRSAEARHAWNEYLQVDVTSPWAEEVRTKHLADYR